MVTLMSVSLSKKYQIFLNVSFLLVVSTCFLLLKTTTTDGGASAISHLLSHSHSSNCSLECGGGPPHELKTAGGYIDYLYIFHSICGRWPVLGYLLLFLWLLVLFYLLGNTASVYFCPSLESLSSLLNLSPTIAGVTLLSLGNGAPDVFASIVSFMGPGTTRDIGLNSILGSAFFVSTVVVGIISILVAPCGFFIEKQSFLRDVCFCLVALSSLLVALVVGTIGLWGAVGYTSVYFVYVIIVYATHRRRTEDVEASIMDAGAILPSKTDSPSYRFPEFGELDHPLLSSVNEGKPHSRVHDDYADDDARAKTSCFGKFLRLVELPLYLPRRLTIPVVCEERWSKPFAVVSVTLAPVLLSVLWNSKRGDMGSKVRLAIYVIGGLIGLILGVLAFVTTKRCGPPKRFLLLWLAGGFLMSVVWTYITAEELVGLMVSLGDILGVSPSILGLTVLAWGNSAGDLIANVTLALKGGPDGVQMAVAGCYAGPIFNILVGLGLSLVLSSWRAYPSTIPISIDRWLLEIMGFVAASLLWALAILPRRGMRLDKVLGCGLIAIYLCFLSLQIFRYS